MPSFATYTLGCKVNQAETADIEQYIKERGYFQVSFKETADYYIINTCSVTHIADRKSRHIIRRAKKTNPQAQIIVTGCFTENSSNHLDELEIDYIIPNTEKNTASLWQRLFPQQPNSKNSIPAKIRRSLKIQDGCSTFCTYCIVPLLRPQKTSLALDEIIKKAAQWTEAGTREIVLTGINLGNYQDQTKNIIDVLQALSKIDSLFRIRLSSLELPHLTEALIREIANNPKICKHLHIPLQAGSPHVLAMMKRPYTLDFFKKTAHTLHTKIANVALTTDVLVGFPGETDEDFKQTLQTIKDCSFAQLHVFKYSPRPGTPAALFENKIDPKISEQRSKILLALSKQLKSNFITRQKNTAVEVLVEKETVRGSRGFTSNYIDVEIKQKNIVGKIIMHTL